MHARHSLVGIVAIGAVLAMTGCGSSGPVSDASSVAGSGGTDASESDGIAQVTQYAEMDPAAQQAELIRVTESIDRQLITLSGLEKELGGAEAADAAYASLTRALVDPLRQQTSASTFGRFGGFVPTADQPTIGGLMFGNFMISALGADAIVSSSNDIKVGDPGLHYTTSGENGSLTTNATGSLSEAKLEAGAKITVDGVTGTLKSVIAVAPCPDATGQFTATTTMAASVTSAGGRTGSNLSLEVKVVGQLNDDAQLVSYDTDARTQSADFANSKGQYVDQSVGWTGTGDTLGNYRSAVNRTGGTVTSEFVQEQGKWGVLTAVMTQTKSLEAVKNGYESGRCVALDPTTDPAKRTGLKPGVSAKIFAAPRSKVDGAPTGGSVTATLSGDASLSPSGSKVPADATFDYVAPSEKNKQGTVALEARSKRGVAKATVAFDTKGSAYTASGTAGNLTFSGSVADITQPFTISASGGAKVTFSYAPTDASGRSGKMTYTGKVSGFKLSGNGTYTITGDDGGVLVLEQKKGDCVAGSLTCTGGSAKITLTPAQ